MKEIPLTQGQVALVDDEDFERVNAFKWYARWLTQTKSFYAARNTGPRRNRKMILMARFIMNTPKGMECDHIQHNTLDNRKNNLRNCTRSQNSMNKRLRSDNTTGFKDISKNNGSYLTQVWANGRYVYCKCFPTLEEAIAARDEAVKKYHGEFACTE
jgi:hypothetical protein